MFSRAQVRTREAVLACAELDRLGLTTKRWTTKAGKLRGGRRFDKNYLYLLLTNRIYIGQIAYRDEVYPAEHPGIIEPEVFQQVQDRSNANRRHGEAESRNKYGVLLRGLLPIE